MSNPIRLFIQRLTLLSLAGWLTHVYAEEFVPQYYSQASSTINNDNTPNTPQPNKNYMSLQVELGRYQIASQKPWLPIPEHAKYRLDKHYESVALLRERLEVTGDLNPNDTIDKTLYDEPLVAAITQFQTRHGLKADGVAGKMTLGELNVLPQVRIRAIQLNMQRWAVLSKQLGDRYIMVNIPDYQLYLFDNGQQVLTMKAVVGKPTLQTPELTSRITRLVFNPYWHVPDKIAVNDIAPKVKEDPYYLSDMHIRVFVRKTGHSEEINGNEIDWENVQHDNVAYDFRQEPGDDNALGLVKFEFPNKYDVYLHDTPVKSAFEQEQRDLSHGCIRLERPFDLVTYLMKDNPKWDEQHTQEILDSHQTKYVSVTRPIPIFITYITVWTDENGVVNYRNDIYQRDT